MAADGWACDTVVHDILTGPVPPADFDAAYSLDVFEHIVPEQEDDFVGNIARSLTKTGVAIIGSPSLQSQAYASPRQQGGARELQGRARNTKQVMERHFENVFLFSMNDEVVHTGFPMAHYLLALCVGRECLSVAEGGQIATGRMPAPLLQTPCFPDQLDSDCQRKTLPRWRSHPQPSSQHTAYERVFHRSEVRRHLEDTESPKRRYIAERCNEDGGLHSARFSNDR